MAQTNAMAFLSPQSRLQKPFEQAVARWPQRPAVEDVAGRRWTYAELAAVSGRLRQRLRDAGVRAGDRIGLCLPKSLPAVAAIYGILGCDAAYVPLDRTAPMERNAYIVADCAMAGVFVASDQIDVLAAALDALGYRLPLWEIDVEAASLATEELFAEPLAAVHGEMAAPVMPIDDGLAYILYTSGSTGRPKGVMLSHRNADAFLRWCSRTFEPRPEDRFSSHAPLHFDLSILDLHLPLRHGACVVLIDGPSGRDPARLAPWIADRGLTVWYSAPSTLALLAQFGHLERHDVSSLRLVLFAGEVFPIKHLRRLLEQVPTPRYFNLYGPTETNVCTFYEIPTPIAADRRHPFPIGTPCAPLQVAILDADGRLVDGPGQGELLVRGETVTAGYWNLPEQTADAFWRAEDATAAWYGTGDLVRRDDDGLLHFLGRRDRMVKRRGFRIELDEIEACLYRHGELEEVAVIAHPHDDGVRIEAILHAGDGTAPSVLELRQFVHRHLPGYMCPDRFRLGGPLPRTSTGKVDYQTLRGTV